MQNNSSLVAQEKLNTHQSLPGAVSVVGLGYVGLQLATAFANVRPTVGFDISPRRIEELRQACDRNGEISAEALNTAGLSFTDDPSDLAKSELVIVAVPTPLDDSKNPDLSFLIEASATVGRALKAGSIARRKEGIEDRTPIVIYESTVYPGCTEEVCIPVLERESGLKAGKDFKVGYSPERINPGDTEHSLDKVIKIVAAQDQETLEIIAQVYGWVAKSGVHKAPNIATAEAAKLVENIQRDMNIAVMNELAMAFHQMGLEPREVFESAGTKWNFLPFSPGLVGGDCVPVNPMYFTHKAEQAGYQPELIPAGRRVNDKMGAYIGEQTIRLLTDSGRTPQGSRVLVLGLSFKENVADARNSQVVSLVQALKSAGTKVDVHDPLVDPGHFKSSDITLIADPFESSGPIYDVVVLAVPHTVFRDRGLGSCLNLIRATGGSQILLDVRGVWHREAARQPGLVYWCL